MAERAEADVRYTAFLSYSHKDAAAAARLHRRLESYRVPKRLVGSESPRGPVSARLWPIFRDREELPAASDLSETVRTALALSGALIILCSPSAAASLWVAEEIETFRKLHPDRPILAAILDGDPPDCFPQALRAFGQDGTWHEPLATDLRPKADGKHLGLLKLVAGITGLGLDDLVQRDAARRIRRVMAVTVVAVIMMLAMAALAVVAFQARREADRQRAEAEGLIEFMMTDLRQGLMGVGRLDLMNNVNRRAMRYYSEQGPLENLSDDSLDRRARILEAMGEDYENSGDLNRARSHYEAVYRTTAALLAKNPNDPERILAHARSENRLALVAITLNHLAEASERLDRTRQLLASIAAWGWNRSAWLLLAAYAEGNTCVTMMRSGQDRQVALRHCRRAVMNNEHLVTLRPDDTDASYALVFHLYWLADAQRSTSQIVPALATQARYLTLVNRLTERDPDNMHLREQQMEVFARQVELLRARGEAGAAERYLEEADTLSRQLATRDPQNAVWRRYQLMLSHMPTRSR
jgi:tetratricopeptide (TPR) repeat protein